MPAGLNVFPRNLADWIAAQEITVWYSVPSLLARLALSGGLERHDWSRLRQIIFAGEVFPVAHLRHLREQIPGARYWNWYGPTETNVCTAYAVDALPPEQTAPVPIGTACANSKLLIVNDAGAVCGQGEAGELYVNGPRLMSGYQAMPEATAHARRSRRRRLWYRTGDLVREDAPAASSSRPPGRHDKKPRLPHRGWVKSRVCCSSIRQCRGCRDRSSRRRKRPRDTSSRGRQGRTSVGRRQVACVLRRTSASVYDSAVDCGAQVASARKRGKLDRIRLREELSDG